MKGIKKCLKKMYKNHIQKKSAVNFCGKYKTWKEAEDLCEGYDSDSIFQKVQKSALMVKSGKAEYDRDTALFYEIKANYPLVMWLSIIHRNIGEYDVIDLGGATGSTYYQNRSFLKQLNNRLNWIVKEQSHFVKFGQEKLETDELHFIDDWNQAPNDNSVLLCSGVIQYIENWRSFMSEAIDACLPKYIIIERTPVGVCESIWVQKVKEPIYNASLPFRILEESMFKSYLGSLGYKMIDEWGSLVDGAIWTKEGQVGTYKSFVFEKEKHD